MSSANALFGDSLETGHQPYRVLARKYRPTQFKDLIGQEALVQVLTNGLRENRLPHAFLLTGIRGVGKTTSARIVARALNCKNPQDIEPCGVCDACKSISESRHIDVVEMDAASHTGVDDVRDLIDASRYRAVSAPYKVYIIDEVHMLSKSAFNALLKTLEEPPAHVKFIFATTELQKIPKTVLSRCMRFDLRRVETETLQQYYKEIVEKEGFTADERSLSLIAQAAEGSVRDGLSLLDQALTLSGSHLSEDVVCQMLGLSDQGPLLDLWSATVQGNAPSALEIFKVLCHRGADPLMVVQELLSLTYEATRSKVLPVENSSVDPEQKKRGLNAAISLPALSRVWQMLLKGVEEVSRAPQPFQAAEMVLIRLAYASQLPEPIDLVRALGENKQVEDLSVDVDLAPPSVEEMGSSLPPRPSELSESDPVSGPQKKNEIPPITSQIDQKERQPSSAGVASPNPASFEELVDLCRAKREALLTVALEQDCHLVHFEPQHLTLRLKEGGGREVLSSLPAFLKEWTQTSWRLSWSQEEGDPTLQEVKDAYQKNLYDETKNHAMVAKTLALFEGATMTHIQENSL